MFNNENQVFSYSREDALKDGVLIDTTSLSKEAGIKFPTAVTVKLWNEYINPSQEMIEQGQSIDGRLWDLLMIFHLEATRSESVDLLFFEVLFQMKVGKEPELIKIKAQCHPGDHCEPVITFLLPGED